MSHRRRLSRQKEATRAGRRWFHAHASVSVLWGKGTSALGYIGRGSAPPQAGTTWYAFLIRSVDDPSFRANAKRPRTEQAGVLTGYVVAHDCGTKRAAMRALERAEDKKLARLRMFSPFLMGGYAAMLLSSHYLRAAG